MKPIKIEFFHDTICSFCFPMAYTMRQLQKALPNIEIIHRSFALAPTSKHLDMMFESHEQAKNEIMHHWERANQLDSLHRFNIEGMKQTSFLFPTSMPALQACKAIQLKEGDGAYFDLFDGLQHALFIDNRDISNSVVILDVASKLALDITYLKETMDSIEVKQAVEADLLLANRYGIHGAPALVINETYLVQGYQSLDQLLLQINQLEHSEVGAMCEIDGC